MRNMPSNFLRVALSILFIPVVIYLVFLIEFGIPNVVIGFEEKVPVAIYLASLFILLTITILPFCLTIYEAWTLLNYIDKGQAFSLKSVISLRRIKYLAVIIGGIFVLILPLTYVIAQFYNAPGFILLALILGFVSLVIAVFASILQKLLYEALLIKEENDLTV